MPTEEVTGQPWTRKHDDPRSSRFLQTERIDYPRSLDEVISICRDRLTDHRLHAAGSHWALSDAAISDNIFVETQDPNPGSPHPVMARTLRNVIPQCLNHDYLARMAGNESRPYLVHVEAGKRIYQLYAELDQPVDENDTNTLAGALRQHFIDAGGFGVPHAFNTLGGAGGQTVVGALNTGTHGGDFDRPPLADSVVALHLVADGGKHYWIEPEGDPPLTADDKLNEQFGNVAGAEFKIVRDDNLFRAVLVSVGRFGIIYSVVLQARRQYQLHERRRLHIWQDIRDKLKDHTSDLYIEPGVNNHFLQVAVCLVQHAFFSKNLVGVTKRWDTALTQPDPPGRFDRVGDLDPNSDPDLPSFSNAGRSHTYNPDPVAPHAPGLLDNACADASFIRGIIQAVVSEIEDFVHSHGVAVGAGIAAVAVEGGSGLVLLTAGLIAMLQILHDILDHFDMGDRFGETMNKIKNALLDPLIPDPISRAAGLFVWQLINYKAFSSQQGDQDYEAISYAVMDQHDYLDQGCFLNVDSVEVFFDSVDDRLVGFIDALINFERQQEYNGRATVGYASIRCTGPSNALLGMQKHPITAAVEVSCLKDVTGGEDLVTFASTLARDPNFNALVHWGQRNEYTRAEVEHRYGDKLNAAAPGDLANWRAALAQITDNGLLDGFSNEFTRRSGLEVLQPRVASVSSDVSEAAVDQVVHISWDALNNPAGTAVSLVVTAANGTQLEVFGNLSLQGTQGYQITQHGVHHFTVQASYAFDGETRVGKMTQDIHVT